MASVVLCTRRDEEPLAERRQVGVGASEKMSDGWAIDRSQLARDSAHGRKK